MGSAELGCDVGWGLVAFGLGLSRGWVEGGLGLGGGGGEGGFFIALPIPALRLRGLSSH